MDLLSHLSFCSGILCSLLPHPAYTSPLTALVLRITAVVRPYATGPALRTFACSAGCYAAHIVALNAAYLFLPAVHLPRHCVLPFVAVCVSGTTYLLPLFTFLHYAGRNFLMDGRMPFTRYLRCGVTEPGRFWFPGATCPTPCRLRERFVGRLPRLALLVDGSVPLAFLHRLPPGCPEPFTGSTTGPVVVLLVANIATVLPWVRFYRLFWLVDTYVRCSGFTFPNCQNYGSHGWLIDHGTTW